MTESRTLGFIKEWGPLLFFVFTLGVAWATMNSRVDQKLDAIRFVSDSARSAAISDRQDRDIQSQSAELKEAINRLSQLICYRSPNPACR